MPVSTRSQIFTREDEYGGTTATKTEQREITHMVEALRNPHHGLKEKLKSLTLLYEQQKLASMGTKIQNFKPQDQKTLPSPALNRYGSFKTEERESNRQQLPPIPSLNKKESLPRSPMSTEKVTLPLMRENSIPNSTVTKTYVLTQPPNPNPNPNSNPNPNPPFDDAKENMAANGDRIVGFSCPRKEPVSTTVARKLSLGSQMEGRRAKIGQEMDLLLQRQINVNSRIMVFVRLRPMMQKEKESGSRSCVRIVNRRDVYLTEYASENDYLRLKRVRGRHFAFDASFPESATQQEVYSTTTSDLVEAVLQGRNGSVFCYGATGAGKTYTMLGTLENPGVMVLAIKDLFTKVRQRSCDGNHIVHLSYLEVYNETVRDLLSPGRPLVLREDKQGIMAAGLSQYRAYSTDEVMALLLQGNKNRTTEPTRMNETSSRSHAILQVMVEYRTRDASSMSVVNRVGKLSLIDLAGSERALATDQRTLRSIEGANINRSLLALSSCINALVEGKKHIPYRNSKLTQILKDSLGGACNTVMIANISPNNISFGETQNTLHWADRAKEIRNKSYERNEELVQDEVSDAEQAKVLLEVQKENRELRVQLAKQQQKLLSLQSQTLASNSSPTPPSGSSILTPPPSSNQRKTKMKAAEETVKELQLVVKALEREMEKMKRDHLTQIKKRDDKIKELSLKMAKYSEGEGLKMLVTRTSLRLKEANKGELKTLAHGHRFHSPAPTAKKRSFWDITTANSPSITTVNGRKTRSHVNAEPVAPPSMLLQLAHKCSLSVLILGLHIANYIIQPGFARQRISPFKQ